jgi:type I restriction enzyme, S subunit
MQGWQTQPIGKVFRIVNGGTPKTGTVAFWDGLHRWITPAEMGGLPSPYLAGSRRTLTDEGLRVGAELVPPQSIILSSRAPIGHLVINEVPMAFNQGCKGLVPSPEIDTKFAYYFLLANVPLLESLGTGATFKELSSGKLKEVLFHFPPLPKQRRIVAILDEALEAIATAKANTEKSLRNAREMSDSFMQSLIAGAGPEWSERALEDVCEIASKLVDPRVPEYLDLLHIGAGNIESKSGAIVNVKTAREERLISGKFLFDENTVLYSKIRPYLMKVVRPSFSGLCSADIYPLVPKLGRIDRDFLYYLLLTPSFTGYAIKGSARAGMPKVNRDHLFAYRSWMPPVDEQARLAKRVDAVARETERLAEICKSKLTALDELKKSFLYQAFTGQLTAKASYQQLESAA